MRRDVSNLSKILKNAPKGLELYSPIIGSCELLEVTDAVINIHHHVGNPPNYYYFLDSKGRLHQDGDCILFPSSKKHTWKMWEDDLFKPGMFVKDTKDFNRITGKIQPIVTPYRKI